MTETVVKKPLDNLGAQRFDNSRGMTFDTAWGVSPRRIAQRDKDVCHGLAEKRECAPCYMGYTTDVYQKSFTSFATNAVF